MRQHAHGGREIALEGGVELRRVTRRPQTEQDVQRPAVHQRVGGEREGEFQRPRRAIAWERT
ncbi:MAG: hypothetical protein ACLGIK_09420, partial [Gemmatimonadota bacterium]